MMLGGARDSRLSLYILRQVLESYTLHGYQLQYNTLLEKGIRGSCFSILLEEQEQPARSLSDIIAVFHTFTISPHACDTAVAIFQRLAEAEAAIRGIDVEALHFEGADVV